MAQISNTPLPMLPHTLGQMAIRAGSLPEGMLRPGQVIQMQVLQSAQAGTSTQVQIAGRTLQAVLPTQVAAGDQMRVIVGRAADGALQMQLASERSSAQLRLPSRDAQALRDAARQAGGLLQVTVREGSKGPEVMIAGRSYSPAEVGVKPEDLPRASWSARIEAGRLIPQREVPVGLSQAPPTLTPLSREATQAIQAAGKNSGGLVMVEVKNGGQQIQIAGRNFAPSELGLAAGQVPRVSWMARLAAIGNQLSLTPTTTESAQVRQLAGNLAVSGDPLALQAALELSRSQIEAPGTYSPEGVEERQGIPWLSLPGGQTAAIQMGPQKLDDEDGGSARVELWGNRIGPVAININRSPAGIQVGVSVNQDKLPELKQASSELSQRIRSATASPTQVTIHAHNNAMIPPEGFEGYG